MEGWRIVDLMGFDGEVRYRRGQLRLTSATGEDGHVPLAELATLLVGTGTTFSAGALHQCCQHDVVVLVCTWTGVPLGALTAWSDHTRVGARHLAQANLSKPRKKNAWGRIVKAKILGQASTVGVFDSETEEHLTELADHVRSGDPDNLEAQAARVYWSRLFRSSDFSRVPGAGSQGPNALLDYGYTVLRGFAIRAITAAGLSPTIGLFHRGRSNTFNLADDLIEPFRPAVDLSVALLAPDADIEDRAVRHSLVAAADQRFGDDGSTISTQLTALAQQLGRYVEGDIPRLLVPTWTGGVMAPW